MCKQNFYIKNLRKNIELWFRACYVSSHMHLILNTRDLVLYLPGGCGAGEEKEYLSGVNLYRYHD